MNPHTPRLHMGCGESLRSHWLLGLVRPECKAPAPCKAKAAKAKRGRARG